jgi:hypothetical protein
VVFMKRKGIDQAAMRSLRRGAEVGHPDDLLIINYGLLAGSLWFLPTATIDSKMNPAAAASFAASEL